MKNILFKILLLCVTFSMGIALVGVAPARAAVNNWQEGVSFMPQSSTDLSSSTFQQSLQNAASTHINYVTLIIPLYQTNLTTTDVQTGWDTPTDASLTSAINYAHSLGLHVMLKPHLDSYTGDWRAYINPSDRTGWFGAYDAMIMHYVQLAQATGVEEFCVGTELIDMSSAAVNPTNTQNWENLIGQIRGAYHGLLTYSANWGPSGFADEANAIQFWGSLDSIGFSAYFNLNGDDSLSNLESQWANYNSSDIQPLSQKWNKPVLFTEVG